MRDPNTRHLITSKINKCSDLSLTYIYSLYYFQNSKLSLLLSHARVNICIYIYILITTV